MLRRRLGKGDLNQVQWWLLLFLASEGLRRGLNGSSPTMLFHLGVLMNVFPAVLALKAATRRSRFGGLIRDDLRPAD